MYFLKEGFHQGYFIKDQYIELDCNPITPTAEMLRNLVYKGYLDK